MQKYELLLQYAKRIVCYRLYQPNQPQNPVGYRLNKGRKFICSLRCKGAQKRTKNPKENE